MTIAEVIGGVRQGDGPTPASLRAACDIGEQREHAKNHGSAFPTCPECLRVAEIIDRETGLPEILKVLSAALAALRSYPLGYASSALAADVVGRIHKVSAAATDPIVMADRR